MRASRVVPVAVVVVVVFGWPALAPAQAAGERIEGTLQAIDLSGASRHIAVQWGGTVVHQRIAYNTRVMTTNDTAGYYPNGAQLDDLKAGMRVRFDYAPDRTLERLHITAMAIGDSGHFGEAPGRNMRPSAGSRSSSPGSKHGNTRELKVRILDVNERRGEFKADVAGRRETFRADEPRLLRRLEVGDLVVITVEESHGDEVVTDIRTASLSGRVVRVDRRQKTVLIEDGSSQRTYRVEDRKLLEGIRVGDKVRFEFEDRPGDVKVITEIH